MEHASDHGGESETSRMLHLREDLVHRGEMGVFPFGTLARAGVDFVRPWHRYVPASAGGDVRRASAEKGRKLIDAEAEHLAELLVQLSHAEWTDAFPYLPPDD